MPDSRLARTRAAYAADYDALGPADALRRQRLAFRTYEGMDVSPGESWTAIAERDLAGAWRPHEHITDHYDIFRDVAVCACGAFRPTWSEAWHV